MSRSKIVLGVACAMVIQSTFFEKSRAFAGAQKDQLVIELMQTAQIEDHLRKTFAELIHDFGGNIDEIKEQLTKEMKGKGFSKKNRRARLKVFEDFHKKIHAAGEPLIRELMNTLAKAYEEKLSEREIKKLIILFKDPVMEKLQQISMELMPVTMAGLQSRALDIVKPLVMEMQSNIKSLPNASVISNPPRSVNERELHDRND